LRSGLNELEEGWNPASVLVRFGSQATQRNESDGFSD
jgi:hypothetical protein